MNLIDLTGQRFGRLTVVNRAGSNRYHKATWECICDCGNEITVVGKNLTYGYTKSCGCLHSETAADNGRKSRANVIKHGDSHEKLYFVWRSMRNRCLNPSHKRYKDWGGRGISVCKEWVDDYNSFRTWAFTNGYVANAARGECTLDRIDNDGDYCPQNCRWVSAKEQAQNRRLSRGAVREAQT